MATEVFIDASFWIAYMVDADQNHRNADDYWRAAIRQGWDRITTNWTLYEALTYLNARQRNRHDLALGLLNLAARRTEIIDAAQFERPALEVFRSHFDKRWSVVDCANFVCIRERRSEFALSFDRDFAQARAEFGFTVLGAVPP